MALPVSTQQKIANLLSHGVQHNVIAAACGISPGRLTQLLETDADLHSLLAAEAAKKIDVTLAREQELEDIEGRLIKAMPTLVEECTSLGEGVRALAMLADMRAKARGYAAPGQGGSGIGAGVQLNLGSVANMQISVVLDQSRAILSLGGQEVLPMPRDTVERFLDNEVTDDVRQGDAG